MVREWVDWMAGIVGLAVRWLAFMLILYLCAIGSLKMDNVATICQSGFSGCLLACLAKRMGLCGVVCGATRENGKKRFGNFAARYGLLLAFGKVFRLPLGRYVALLVVWMIFCGIFALAQIFLGLGVTCFVSFR